MLISPIVPYMFCAVGSLIRLMSLSFTEKAGHKITDKFGHAKKEAEREGGKMAKEGKRKVNDLSDEAKETAEEYTGKA